MTVDIANRLVELRKRHGYSQEKLAELLGLSRQAVSKWERAEASPDTDNLILLSRLYGVSLDELLQSEADNGEFVKPEPQGQDGQEERQEKAKNTRADTRVNIGFDGIHVVDGPRGDEVRVGWRGIHVTEAGKEKVRIGKDGIYVDEDGQPYVGKRGRVVVNGIDYTDEKYKKRFWLRFPFTLLVVIAIIVIAFIQGSLYPVWLLLFAIPILDSLIKAIYFKDIHLFAFPILALVSFLWVGLQYGLWHPGWVIFLTIPLWYSLLPRRKKQVEDEAFWAEREGE